MEKRVSGSNAEAMLFRYKKLKDQGLCTRCSSPANPNQSMCKTCSEKRAAYGKEYKKKYRSKNKEIEDDDKGEYKMTDGERKDFNRRWQLVFSSNL